MYRCIEQNPWHKIHHHNYDKKLLLCKEKKHKMREDNCTETYKITQYTSRCLTVLLYNLEKVQSHLHVQKAVFTSLLKAT